MKNRKITTEDALRMMQKMPSGGSGGSSGVSDIYPVGAVYLTSTNTNPETFLDGTWELITKELKDAVYSFSGGKGLTLLNASSADVYISTSGNTINVELGIVTAAELGESSVKWIEVDWSKVGVTGFPWSQRFMLYSDGANGVAYGTCHYNDKSIMTNDFLSKTGSAIASGATIYGSFNFTMTKDYLLDEYCDKFYWKRTA